MNREIKFRAWEIGRNRMNYDIHDINYCGKFITLIWGGNYTASFNDIILQQFTGLQDKNGKDIYEGDIINVDDDVTSYVEYKNGLFINALSGWGLHTYLSMPLPYYKCEIEVIGNIYETPELL